MTIKEIVAGILAEKKETGGVRQVFYAACGGSYGAFYPAKAFLENEAKELRVGLYNSNEFVHSPPAALGENSLVIVASHKGDTPETIKAAQLAQERGVPVVALTFSPESELTRHADHVLDYSFGPGKDIAREKTVVGLLLAVELLAQTEGYAHYDAFYDGVSRINNIVRLAEQHVESRALAFAQEHKEDRFIYTMGSGAGYGAAYMESICIFMEMQWINSAVIHTGEYFHGPFEITDAEVPFVIQLSEGRTRPLDERALSFLKKYARRVEVLDAKELGLSVIDANVVDYFNHSLFNNVYAIYNAALAEARQHPLSTRRYMWKVAY